MKEILLAMAMAAAQAPPPTAAAPVQASAEAVPQKTVRTFLDAISSRDVAMIREGLSRTVEPQILYYWGETVSGADTIAQWHKEWFEEKEWTIEAGPIIHASVDRRLAIISHDVRYKKSATREFVIRLGYTLVAESGEWKVARIQQTLLKGPE